MTLRTTLRAATRQDHDRVDRLGGAFDLASPEGYGAFLLGHAAVLPPLEAALDAAPPQDLPPSWPERRRAGALLADLAELGFEAPAPALIPAPTNAAERVGALYVLEGSRLGGALLRRRLAEAQPAAPIAYLAHGQGEPLWRTFLEWLDSRDLDPAETAAAVDGARGVFAAFEAGFTAVAPTSA
ncbi:biliverdin-producing heme oxygenase [Phenylobacterium sp.]|uniref:biliverdin-producing heme oxygenase n=1 Tax=Phenylobacterium sp. TaxID=1871053 RepID=UPI00272FD32B|nr:biliverdin-producing heme oxygenase [Phenylobacterium sp.]MDP1617453.1 biliverdin-producing heme oxygenase [Phenylobacterium sp.]MDP1988790.1 biliverdin-producing heme oxygenase [Phenylobacterium sp.]